MGNILKPYFVFGLYIVNFVLVDAVVVVIELWVAFDYRIVTDVKYTLLLLKSFCDQKFIKWIFDNFTVQW